MLSGINHHNGADDARGCHALHMIAPVSAGTDSIHTMPAGAAGSADTMTAGSSHDWKFTTIGRYRTIAPSAILTCGPHKRTHKRTHKCPRAARIRRETSRGKGRWIGCFATMMLLHSAVLSKNGASTEPGAIQSHEFF
ncbi:hypothetical protein GCM10007388_22030 [Pseudoduganella plicata]|uniref:Uncharacterized protein n=1 Tax=Pseudoduganella plicata TaxID=321984 RepID=A0AA87Y700_9BURK|nr:hypothetical protein GCM10007388_22030 [Pseudoduganella plicata]